MNKTTHQNTGFDSPVNKDSGFLNARDKKNSGNNNSDIEDFNYAYNKSAENFETGYVAEEGGVFVCKNCGTEVLVADGANLPPCPRCNNLDFTQKS